MSYVQPGWLGGEGDEQGGTTSSVNLQSHAPGRQAPPLGGGQQDPATPPAPITGPASSSRVQPASRGRGRSTRSGPPPAAPTHWPPALQSSGPLRLGPGVGPGTQQACADLATYRYLLHHPRSRGSVHSDPAARPGSRHKNHQDLQPAPSRPDQVKRTHPRPVLRPAGLGSPSCLHLRVGATRCVSEGCVLGWRLLWQQRVKANLPGLPSAPPGQGAPGWRDQLAITWLWGSPSGLLLLLPSNPPPSSQTTAGAPSLRHSRTHPVSSTLSPHTVLVQAAPLYYTRKSAPAPQGGCRVSPAPPALGLTRPIEDGGCPLARSL